MPKIAQFSSFHLDDLEGRGTARHSNEWLTGSRPPPTTGSPDHWVSRARFVLGHRHRGHVASPSPTAAAKSVQRLSCCGGSGANGSPLPAAAAGDVRRLSDGCASPADIHPHQGMSRGGGDDLHRAARDGRHSEAAQRSRGAQRLGYKINTVLILSKYI